MIELAYGQRFEDLHLLRALEGEPPGFYIDIGAGHPVVDNVSFAFYLRGWRGVTVEPNRHLSDLSRGARPRDVQMAQLVGAAPGEATYYQVRDFHGFSTTIAAHAQTAESEYGKSADKITLPVTTLREICERHAPSDIGFVKIDVEGAERDVLLGGDWQRFRPKIVLAEALAPFTLEPAWPAWEPILTKAGYRFAFFDELNRYYVAEEHPEIARRLAAAPASYDHVLQVGMLEPALTEQRHPDRPLAELLAKGALTRLPLLPAVLLLELLTADVSPVALGAPADASAMEEGWRRVFGTAPARGDIASLDLPEGASLRDFYTRLAASDAFRTACGRISASYAW